jgi:hypothetical protein
VLQLLEVEMVDVRDQDDVGAIGLRQANTCVDESRARRPGDERKHAGGCVPSTEIARRAFDRRDQLGVAHGKTVLAELASDHAGRDVARVREHDQWSSGGADALEHLDRPRQRHSPAVGPALDERPVEVEDEASNVVKPHDATPRSRRPWRGRST